MSLLLRWSTIVLITMSLLVSAAVAIPRYLMPSSTLSFWVVDGLGGYHYYYDFNSESLYLDEQWNPNAIIAPDGKQAIILNRGRNTILIDHIDSEGIRESLGEYPIDPIDLMAYWSSDSQILYMADRSEVITIYAFDVASTELSPIIEYEHHADNLFFEYDAANSMLITGFFNFSTASTIELYNLETEQQSTIESDFFVPTVDWAQYVNFDELDGEESDILSLVSLIDDTNHILPMPDEGEIVSLDFILDDSHLMVSTIQPDATYILELATEEYTQVNIDKSLSVWSISPDERYALMLDYRFIISGGTGIMPWYSLDLETYEVRHLFDRYNFNVMRNPTGIDWSPNNQKLAVIVNDFRSGSTLEIISLVDGQILHRLPIPDNRIAPVSTGFGDILDWYGAK